MKRLADVLGHPNRREHTLVRCEGCGNKVPLYKGDEKPYCQFDTCLVDKDKEE